MLLTSYGAARTVTGSRHVIEPQSARGRPGPKVLLDCGLVQGRRQNANAANKDLGFGPTEIGAVILSHAHIDHSGALPLLVKTGFQGTIFATPATRDLCAVMLRDSAYIQKQDAEYLNRRAKREGRDETIEPLYDERDVQAALGQFVAVPYRRPFVAAPGVQAQFLDAGHVLGSSVTVVDVDDGRRTRRLAFTGDLGRRHMPILKDPEVAERAEILITESTYGNRLHDPIEKMDDELLEVVRRTVGRGGKVLIPSFALERAQEILFALRRLSVRGAELPRVPIYLDSPLTIAVTEVFKLHVECFDDELKAFMRQNGDPFSFAGLHYISRVEDSMKLNTSRESCIIVAASGMCESGRIVHHLRNHIEDKRNTVALVGYQAEHTLGRRIQERRPRVKIFGVERDLNAEVVVLAGFSAHADQKDLVGYAEACRNQGGAKKTVLVHGEQEAMDGFAGKLGERGFENVVIPERGRTVEL